MKKSMKRFIAVICVAVMLVGVMSVANLKQVNATEATEEKTVFAEEVTSGTVTPGNGNTEQCSEEGYVFGGYYDNYNTDTKKFSNPITEERDASQDSVFIRWVPEEVMTVKAQVREDEYKEVLTNCDSKDSDSNIYEGDNKTSGQICSDKNYVLEGVGSLQNTVKPLKNNTTYYNIYLKDSINVLGYKYFSCKLYLSTVNEFPSEGTTLIIGIKNSYGNINNDCLQFYVDTSDLKEGWNDLKLPFASAEIIRNGGTDDMGRWNGSVKYIRILQLEGKENAGELTTYLDDVCVLNDSEGILVADCDQLDSPNSTGAQKENTLVNISSESTSYSGTLTLTDTAKEGTKAVKTTAYKNQKDKYCLETKFKLGASNKLNIVSYQKTGSLHLWLYIPDTTKLQGDFNIFLTSGNSIADNAIYLEIKAADLKDEWNEITLPFSEAKTKGSNAMDWTSVQYIMIRTTEAATEETYRDMYMIIDDIRVVNRVQVLECDSLSEVTKFSTTSPNVVQQDVKQGSGAFEVSRDAGGAKTIYNMTLSKAIDFSAWMGKDENDKPKNGCLHLWFYVDRVENIGTTLSVDIDSDSKYTTRMRYPIGANSLMKGWNELYINLDGIQSTSLDMTKIQYIRIVTQDTGACTTRIDDVSLISGNAETLDVRFISTVDSLEYQSVGYEITQSRSQNPLETETTNVYKNIWASNKNGVLDNVKPSDVSGVNCSTYMHLVTLVNIPARLWDATFTVTPYWKTQDGTTVKGAAQPYTMNKLMSITKQSQEDSDFRVIVTSDVHYTNLNNDTKEVYDYNADERMQLWVDSILAEHEVAPIDLVIINGDESLDYRAVDGGSMLQDGTSETKAFVETYVSQLRKKMPVVILPGNHEQYNDEQWMEITGNHRNETYVLGNNLFIMPDSYGSKLNPMEASDGTYSAFDMDYINKTILQFPEHKVYIVSHYLDMSKQNAEFLNLLQTNDNIVGLFSGHTHSALTLGGENDATYGGKTVAQTGHFSWTQGEDTTFWGFRDLTITSDSATCKYISVPATVTVEGQQTTYARTESNVIVYYSSEQ